MLRITPCVGARRAKSYFKEALRTGDYFTAKAVLGQEIAGLWGGLGAERLGLKGPVTDEGYHRLCDNLHPVTGEKLTARTKDGRRVCYDFTFSVPKSVSVLAELGEDPRIVTAFREAVAETLRDMESSMRTRVRRGGADDTRPTGEMTWAEFVHFTSRPVDGVPDMHLHRHAIVFNQTWDPVERRWKAGEFGDIKRDAPYHQAACDARLAMKLATLGYAVERRGDGWEIAGIPESLVRMFSRRTEEIEKLAEELGITNPDVKAGLGAKSRSRKAKSLSMDELRREWRSRLSEDERRAIREVRAGRAAGPANPQEVQRAAERSIDFALLHSFERASVVSEKRLLAVALQRGIGMATPGALSERLATLVGNGSVLRATLDNEVMVTTKAVLAEEQRLLATVRDGRGQHTPLKPGHAVADPELSEEQRKAVGHVLQSTDSVILLRGKAGVGKTRTMQEVVQAIESSGRHVLAAAPTGMASHEVLRKDGFKNAQTTAFTLVNRETRDKLRGNVLWVDEAGLLSVPDMAKLVRLAKESNARLLLTGDTRQHRSVNRGDALRLLETECGLKAAELKQVRRQERQDYRKAAEALARGDLVGGFKRLDAMGAIREGATQEERARLVAQTCLAAVKGGLTTLVVAPTHAEGRVATAAIRETLKANGTLGEKEVTLTRLFNRQLSEAERGDAARHRVGDVVQFHRNAHGRPGCFRPSDRAEVIAVAKDFVTVHRLRDKVVTRLPLHAAKAFQVFEKRELKVAAGDRIRITYTGRASGGKHRLNNGAIYTIDRIDEKGGLVLRENGWRIPKGFGHLTHGYAVTSDASQGRTIGHIVVSQSELSSAASNMQQWYTSITRGKTAVTVVTDDKARLLRSLARDNSRLSATEFMKLAMTPPRERGMRNRRHVGLWVAKENSRRLKESVNRHLEREARRRERTREQERRRRHQREQGGMNRER